MSNDRPDGGHPPLKLRPKRRLLPELELDLRRPRRRVDSAADDSSPATIVPPADPAADIDERDDDLDDAQAKDTASEPARPDGATTAEADPSVEPEAAGPALADPTHTDTDTDTDTDLSLSQPLATPPPEPPTTDEPPSPDEGSDDRAVSADEGSDDPAVSADVPGPVVAPLPPPLPPPLPSPLPPPLPAVVPPVADLPHLAAPAISDDVLPPATRRERRAATKAQQPPKPAKPPKTEKPAKPSKAEKPAKPPKAEKPTKPPKAEKPAKPPKAEKPAKPLETAPRPRGAPMYWRVLRLRHVHPNGWQRAVLLEGVIGAAIILVLAGQASLWTLLVLPVVAAALVKLHDVLMGSLASAPTTPSHPDGKPTQPPATAKQKKRRRRGA